MTVGLMPCSLDREQAPVRGSRHVNFFPKNSSLLLAKNLKLKPIQLLAVDHSARASMKNAASCEN